MNQAKLDEICCAIKRTVGADVSGELDRRSNRLGFKVWFAPFGKLEGPQFTLKPSGLKRHKVTMQFGNYSKPCIEQIQEFAREEHYSYSRALVESLSQDYSVVVSPNKSLRTWVVEPKLQISVVRKDVEGQRELNEIKKTSELMLSPLVACMAELIGLEIEEPSDDSMEEGSIFYQLTKRRERNPRNRLICFSVHPKKCLVCDIDPSVNYGQEVGALLEVHHVEPLSQLEAPKVYNPLTDLIPLCPNCHRAAHKRVPAFTPNELKNKLNSFE
jgi:5-methylcytosine-specific restriction protein A